MKMSEADEKVSLKLFFLNAALWLPLGFAVWFYVAGFFAWPSGVILAPILEWWMPGVFPEISQQGQMLEVLTSIAPESRFAPGAEGRVAVLALTVNPMIYGYGLPLFFALVMSTPLKGLVQLRQISIAFVLVSLLQTFGVFWELMKHLQFSLGPEGQKIVAEAGLQSDVIALMYQSGYLILPGLFPLLLWVLLNRGYIESLAFDRQFQVGKNE